ncbi:MAG: helix-turn-helix domain-containing protein [Pirellulaceae bacterium]
MKIELTTHDIEPLVRKVVQECLRQVYDQREHLARKRGDQPASPKLLLNSAEAAKMLDISERTLWELKRSGELPFVPMGNGGKRDSVRYAVADLTDFIERRKRAGQRTMDDDSSSSERN